MTDDDALTIYNSKSTAIDVERALPQDRVEAIASAIADSKSENTKRAYGRAWRQFATWCEKHGRNAIKCRHDTLAAYVTALEDGTATGKKLAPSSIEVAISAVIAANRLAGHEIERKASAVADVIKAAKVKAGSRHSTRQVQPIKASDVQALLEIESGDRLIDLRDDAIVALGFAGGLRRSEVVGLDLTERRDSSDGTGVLKITDDGIEIALLTSKASQGVEETVALPRQDASALCDTIYRYIESAALRPRAPVFQSIRKGNDALSGNRLHPGDVARIIKRRIHIRLVALYMSRGQTRANAEIRAETEAKEYAGHSLRRGLITSLAEAKVPTYRIQVQSRHKTADMVGRYVKEADKWTDNVLSSLKLGERH